MLSLSRLEIRRAFKLGIICALGAGFPVWLTNTQAKIKPQLFTDDWGIPPAVTIGFIGGLGGLLTGTIAGILLTLLGRLFRHLSTRLKLAKVQPSSLT